MLFSCFNCYQNVASHCVLHNLKLLFTICTHQGLHTSVQKIEDIGSFSSIAFLLAYYVIPQPRINIGKV